jgi:NCAIR mutase (PurE)-related protein
MDRDFLTDLLERYKHGTVQLDAALDELKDFPLKDLSFAHLDTHRHLRTGYPEVVYCEGKTPQQLKAILEFLLTKGSDILGTRASDAHFSEAASLSPDLKYDPLSRTISLRRSSKPLTESYIAVVTAGTSDIPVAEEAAVTAELFGSRVERIFDVGVAGLHRVIHKIEIIRKAKIVIAVAGMEGALPGVLGGLIDAPIIAVPTSVGYGASFKGLSALLTMLNSCSSGIAVVNIDNGFGAGFMADKLNRL